MTASSHIIQFKLSVHIQGGLRHVPFSLQISDLNAHRLASWITHFDDSKSEQDLIYVLARPVLFVDGNGNQIFINANEKDFVEFVAYLRQHAHVNKTEIILDLPEPGSLLQKMITGNRKVLSWDGYKNGLLELSLTEINHLFKQQISDDSMQKIREKQSYSFVNVFSGWSPPSPEKELSDMELSESGLLNLKRVTRNEVMNLLKGGIHILVPSEDSSYILMTFSKLQGSGHNFFCWQEQNDGNYKCQEVKIPVNVGRQLITYYSNDGKTLREKFDDLVKNDIEHVLPSTPSAEMHVINTEYKKASKRNGNSELEITQEYEEAQRNAETTSDVKKSSDDAKEKCFTLGAHTLYYTGDFLKGKVEVPYNCTKSAYVVFFSKAIGDNFPDFNNIMLMPKLVPPSLECSVHKLLPKPGFNMYSITIASKGVCGIYDCWLSLKELSSDTEFEFKIPVIVMRHFSSTVDEKSGVNHTEQLASSFNSEQPAINDQDDVCDTNEVIYRKPVTVETVDPPVVQQEVEKTNDHHDEIVESKNEGVVESDSDSSISVSIEELNITDETSDAFEVIDLPSCFVSSTAEDAMQESVKVRVKRRKLASEQSDDKLKCPSEISDAPSVFDPEPLSSAASTNSSYQQFNPVNDTATCSSVSEEQQPVNILPDKVFEMTSNVFNSVFMTVKKQMDEIQKPIFTASNSVPPKHSQCEDVAKSTFANFVFKDWPKEEACLASENLQTSGQSWSATCEAQRNATKSPEKAKTPDTVPDTFFRELSCEMQTQLDKLNEMGFLNDHHNIFLLKQYPNDMLKVIESLCNYGESG